MTGAAIEAAVNAAITYTAAFIYLKAISVLAFRKAENMSDEDLKNAIDLYMKNNKDEVKAVFSDAKNTFKKDKSIVNNQEAAKELEKEMRAEQEATNKETQSEDEDIANDIKSDIKNDIKNLSGTGAASASEKVITCASCGAELPENAKFCFNCGYKLKQILKCSVCGEELQANAKFCFNCGTKVEKM